MSKKKIIAACLAAFLAGGAAAVGGVCYLAGFRAESLGDLARFLGARRFIESRYVGDVDDGKLMDGAISGMVQALGDPHSIYLDPEMYGQLMDQTEGSFGGIGVYMGFKDGGVQIVSVMEGTPTARRSRSTSRRKSRCTSAAKSAPT